MKKLKIISKGISKDKRSRWEEEITEINIYNGEIMIMYHKNGIIEKVVDAIKLSEHPHILITCE